MTSKNVLAKKICSALHSKTNSKARRFTNTHLIFKCQISTKEENLTVADGCSSKKLIQSNFNIALNLTPHFKHRLITIKLVISTIGLRSQFHVLTMHDSVTMQVDIFFRKLHFWSQQCMVEEKKEWCEMNALLPPTLNTNGFLWVR